MQKAVNFFRGSIRAEVFCPYPERFVNICAQNNIEFWDLQRVSKSEVRISLHIGGYRRLKELASRGGFTVKPVRKRGMPYFMWRIRKRYVLLAGMLLCVAAVWVLSMFVWEIDVSGNINVPREQILQTLDGLGVGIGIFGPMVDSEKLANEMLLAIPELSWFAINVSGSHADVLVRERIQIPEIIDENEPTMVYAEKSGLITKMNVLEGVPLCKTGDTVVAGDVIVTGKAVGVTANTRFVHAMADVYARTWYEFSSQMPINMYKKRYTGDSQTFNSIIIAENKINLYFNGGNLWYKCDKIYKENNLRLPSGNLLPIALVTGQCSEYELQPAEIERQEAEEILKEGLLRRLEKETEGGEIVATSFSSRSSGGVITVTLRAECLEQIGRERGFTSEELEIEHVEETETQN